MSNTHGGARPNSGPKPTPINTTRLQALLDQKISKAEIGRRFGVEVGVITRAIKRMEKEKAK